MFTLKALRYHISKRVRPLLNLHVPFFKRRFAFVTESNLSGHFRHSCFELTFVEISQGRVEGHLTIAS